MNVYLLICLVAAAVTYLVTPVVRALAIRAGAITPLRERDSHDTPTPRLGGLAMLAGVLAAFAVAAATPFLRDLFVDRRGAWGILAAAVLICVVGAIDDVFDLDPFTKLAGQVLAAFLMAWQGVQLVSLPLGGITVGSGGMFLALTVLVVVLAMNAVNFVDGLDGLASGLVGIGGMAFFVYTYLLTRQSSPLDYASLGSLVAATLVGCCLGFLPHNAHPAHIFMGDSGALLLGLLMAASSVAVTGQIDPTVVSGAAIMPVYVPILLPFTVLVVPLADLVLSVIRRVSRGQSPFAADRGHLHHRLLDLGHSHPNAVWVMYLWTAVVAFGTVLTVFIPPQVMVPGLIVAVLCCLAVTFGPGLRRRHANRHPPSAPVHDA